MSRYFKAEEFRKCVPACDISDMSPAFLAKLDRVRERAGIPLVLNCAYRTRQWDKAKGRTGTSAHCTNPCVAVDIRCRTSANRFKIVRAAIEEGIRRIGIAKTYVHLDDDPTKAQDVIWDYYD